MNSSRRSPARALPLALALAATSCLYLATIRPEHHWGGDFSVYLEQTRNLLNGLPFSHTSYLGTPEALVQHPSPYPPMLSVLMLPVYAKWGLNYVALKALLQVLFLLSLPCFYFIGRLCGLDVAGSLFAMLTFACSSIMLNMKESICSEAPFLLFSGAALALILWVRQSKNDDRRPLLWGLVAGVLLLLAYASRAAGMALILAFVLSELWSARRLRVFGIAAIFTLAIGLGIYTRWVYNGGLYGNEFYFSASAYKRNLVGYLKSPAQLWGSVHVNVLRYALAGVSLVLAGIALCRRTLQRPGVLEFYFWITLAMITSLTAGAGYRYMLPIFPLYCVYMVEGASFCAERFVPSRARIAVAAFYGVFLLGTASNVIAIQTGPVKEGIARPDFVAACQFIQTHTSPDEVLLSWNPRVLAFYTQHRSGLYPKTADFAQFLEKLHALNAAYLLDFEGDPNRQDVEKFVRAAQPREVFHHGGFHIYRVPAGGNSGVTEVQ